MTDRHWHTLEIVAPAALEDALSGPLFEHGSLGSEIRAAGSGWVRIISYFSDEVAAARAEAGLREFLARLGNPPGATIAPGAVPDEDWDRRTRESFQPIRAGHFVIEPSWHPVPDQPGQVRVRLDPGQAFGTGSHETTRLCLAALERHFQPSFRRILDAGCGSGILLIALALWLRQEQDPPPADHVMIGIDLDPTSIAVAGENLLVNGVDNSVSLLPVPLERFEDAPFHFILANLLSEVVCQNLSRLDRLLLPGGTIIISGILADEEDRMSPLYAASGWRPVETLREGDWIAQVLGKPNRG